MKGNEHALHTQTLNPGKDTVFILVHGIGVSMRYFMPLAGVLAKNHTVVMYDLAGFGQSQRPRKALDLDEHSQSLKYIIDRNKSKKIVLVGHSLGCQIIAQFLCVNPSYNLKAALIAPTINRRERNAPRQFLRLLQNGLSEPLKLNWIVVSDYVRSLSHYFKTLHYMFEDKIEARLPMVTSKIVIIRGENDSIVPHDWAAYLTSVTPKCRLIEIRGAAHAAQFSKPEDVSAACVEVL